VVFFASILHAAVILVVSVVIWSLPNLYQWAHFLGVLGTVLAAVQFLPQIWTTWRLQAVGSLSIPTMCIQTPGSALWVGSLAARFGWEGWSTWGIYLVTGVLQGVLLAMSISFGLRDQRKKKREEQEGENEPTATNGIEEEANARTRLMGNER